jgi:hypothetical protein
MIFVALAFGCAKGGGENKNSSGPTNRLVITDLQYRNVGHTYELDSSLNLKVIKSYRLTIQVSHQDLDLKIHSGDLNGDYGLSVSLLPLELGETNQDAYVFNDNKTVSIVNGVINTEVKLAIGFAQLPVLVSPSQIFVELQPVNPISPVGLSMSARFENFTASGRLSMESLSDSASELIQTYVQSRGLNAKSSVSVSGREQMKDALKLHAFGVESLSGIGVSVDEFDSLIKLLREGSEVSQAVARKFCPWIFPYPTAEWKKCLEHPEQALTLFGSRHIDKLTSQPKIQSVDAFMIQMSDFTFTESTSTEEQYAGTRDTTFLFNLSSLAAKVEGRFGFDFLGTGGDVTAGLLSETGIRFGKEWFHVRQHINRQTKNGVRSSYSKNRNLQVQEWQFQFGAEMDKCLSIVSKAQGRGGVQVCKRDSQKAASERWYFVNQASFDVGSPISLNDNSGERLLSTVVRGKGNFEEMVKLFTSNEELVFERSASRPGPIASGAFPGLI